MENEKPKLSLQVDNSVMEKLSETQRLKVREIVDPRYRLDTAPKYEWGQLPKPFENYVRDCVAAYGGDPGAYACGFIAMHAALLHNSVQLQTNPLKPDNWRVANDFTVTVGETGVNKSGAFHDMTRESQDFEALVTKDQDARRKANPEAKLPLISKSAFIQTASIEAALDQILENDGEPLLIGVEEAMTFYDGAAAHHKDIGAQMMSDIVCLMYDGRPYKKKLRSKEYNIPNMRATLIMATTIDRFRRWKNLQLLINSGMMARHTFGLVSRANSKRRDPSAVIPGADKKLKEVLHFIRGMRNVRFVIAPDAHKYWHRVILAKEDDNLALSQQSGKEGVVAWSSKYDLRILSLAQFLQTYEYYLGGQKAHTVETRNGPGKDEVTEIKTIQITKETLKKAVAFHEGFLFETQEFFYSAIGAEAEFADEVVNNLARILVNKMEFISRDDLCGSSGPSCLRGRITDDLLEKRRRFVRIVLEHGHVEPDYENMRNFSNPRDSDNCSRYRVPPEVHMRFASDIGWFQEHYARLRDQLDTNFKRKALNVVEDDE